MIMFITNRVKSVETACYLILGILQIFSPSISALLKNVFFKNIILFFRRLLPIASRLAIVVHEHSRVRTVVKCMSLYTAHIYCRNYLNIEIKSIDIGGKT